MQTLKYSREKSLFERKFLRRQLIIAATRQRQAAELVSHDTKDNCKGNRVTFLLAYYSFTNWNDHVKKHTVPSTLRGHLSWELYRFQFNTLSSMKECFTRVHRCDVYVMVNKRSTVNIGFDIQGQKRVILDQFKHMTTSLFRVLKDILGKSCLHRCHNNDYFEDVGN